MRAHYSPELVELLDRQATQSWIPIEGDPLTFILCAARTGSTLLRLLLNRHPEVASPPETNASGAAHTLGRLWMSANRGQMPDAGIEACRRAVTEPLNEYAKGRGKRLWCEKSLCNAIHAEMLTELFPEARFICLYRNCMDMVISGIETSQWGYSSFGFEPYAQASSDNLVAAIVRYWVEQTQMIRVFERSHQQICYRLYYECLVSEPRIAMEGLLSFLGLDWSPTVIQPEYAHPHDLGFGDHKALYSDHLDKSRIGLGHRVPLEMVPPTLLKEVNDLLVDIGYPAVGPEWNRTRSRLRVFDSAPTQALDRLTRILKKGLATSDIDESIHAFWPPGHSTNAPYRFRLIIDDVPFPDGDWCIDLRTRQVLEFDDSQPGGVDFHVVASSGELVAIAERKNQIGDAMRANALRIFGTLTAPEDMNYLLGRLLGEFLIRGAEAEEDAQPYVIGPGPTG
jgi:hypothetical protein